MTDRIDHLRAALQAANDRADAAIERTETRLDGRTAADERLRAFVNGELAPALTALQQAVVEQGGTLVITREYNDPTQVRYLIEGGQPEPSREPFRATLGGRLAQDGQIEWRLAEASGTPHAIENGTAAAIGNAVLDAYIQALEGC